MADHDYEVSGAYIAAVVQSLKAHEKWNALQEKLAPPVLEMVGNPWGKTWHAAMNLEQLGEAAIATVGSDAFYEAAYVASRDRFGPIVLPMLKKSLDDTNRSPVAILSRMSSLVNISMHHVEMVWKPDFGNSGMLQVNYPRPVAPHIIGSWGAVLRYVFEVTQSTGRVERTRQPAPHILQYLISW
jgi:hypothetical protein